jgi:FkbM family methyltransferase
MNKVVIVKLLYSLIRYIVAIHNLGFANTVYILCKKFFLSAHTCKIKTKTFGNIYWRPKFDFGVFSHLYSPAINFSDYASQDFFYTENKKIKIIFDLGANIGIESVRFRKLFPLAQIISIEPNKSNFEILKKNLSQHNFIKYFNLAIWNNKTKLKLKSYGNSSTSFSYEELKSLSKNESTLMSNDEIFVDAETIDNLMKTLSISEIDILKIDVEGAEKYIFDNSSDKWISKINIIIAECPDKEAPFTVMNIYDSFLRNKLFFNTYINGENLIFIKEGYDFLPKISLFYK